MSKQKILVLLGMSATGKDSVLKEICKCDNFINIVSHTTRPQRLNETEGVEYYFRTKEEFDKIPMIEKREYKTLFNGIEDTWYYGLSMLEMMTKLRSCAIPIVILDLHGFMELKKWCIDNNIDIISVYIESSAITRTIRALKRGNFSFTEWFRRMIDDAKVFKNVKDFTDYSIRNYDVKDTALNIIDRVMVNK